MHNHKTRLHKLERKITRNKRLYKIYCADGTLVGTYYAKLAQQAKPKVHKKVYKIAMNFLCI